MSQCTMDLGWGGRCKADAVHGGRCEDHSSIKCCVCGELATTLCDYCGQFVYGYPLCPNCEGWEDRTESAGVWGTLNHHHRRKDGP